ncbi:YigZ family protein [Aquibacillus halophilus]|uniref:YigZ family protein n=1 Tax=Aquibacillus halophilus TaxID=930132 RepID=A0A6A8DL39_9BACI|nr:YigZ family protein [Aquibacillus halophilus]MRH41962.1 YigZ family protein [Aquibacillus halophilus]
MLSHYYTVNLEGTDEIVIQKSRFIGHVKRVETEEDAQEFIKEIKKKHHDANHNCSAYMIGEHDLIQKANDDGEPTGTAGVPILEVLKKKELKDTAVVITRYFGGIKLGAGGLIRAYSSATSQAIDTTGIVIRKQVIEMIVTADYSLLGKLENNLRNSSDYILEKIDYTENVILTIAVGSNQEDNFREWIVDLSSDQVMIEKGKTKYIENEI